MRRLSRAGEFGGRWLSVMDTRWSGRRMGGGSSATDAHPHSIPFACDRSDLPGGEMVGGVSSALGVVLAGSPIFRPAFLQRDAGMMLEFTVGINIAGERQSVTVSAEDALIAALQVKRERPEATINYVRRSNRRGDRRHPHKAIVAAASK